MEQSVSTKMEVHRDAEAAALAAAARFVEIGRSAIEQRGRFCVALAGGATPMRMYEMLADAARIGAPRILDGDERGENSRQSRHDDTLDWGLVHVFFGDERCVPPDHADSNYAMVRRCLLDRVDVPDHRVHRIKGEVAPCELAADRYDSMLRKFFGVRDVRPPLEPTFDLVLLGIGEDGHTASLFPGSQAVAEVRRWAVHTQAPDGVESRDRITLTLPVINAARRVMFVATGANKSYIVRTLLSGLGNQSWPATLVHCAGAVEWHVDEAAAGRAAQT
jgi:6-phosphogluconolactonase